LPIVGSLIAGTADQRRPLPERLFYGLAYGNLVLAGGILFIVALWRWG